MRTLKGGHDVGGRRVHGVGRVIVGGVVWSVGGSPWIVKGLTRVTILEELLLMVEVEREILRSTLCMGNGL